MSVKLGQHFLRNRMAIKKIVASLELRGGETLIEIGPGEGALTFPLLHECRKIGAKFITIEKDRELAVKIFQADPEIKIEEGDALEVLPELAKHLHDYKIVGNIPYYITGKLLRTISELENKPLLTVLMIQKEVAERICAQSKGMNPVRGREGSQRASASNGMNLLAAATQIWAEPKILFSLAPEDFDPPPDVKSAVISLKTKTDSVPEKYFDFVHIIFKQPRKTLFNNLREGLDTPKEAIEAALKELRIDPNARPQNVSIERIKEIAEKLS